MRIGVVVMFAAGILAASLPALADDGAVGYRQKVMDAVGSTMEAMVHRSFPVRRDSVTSPAACP